jgi:hypothetical protein
LKEIILRTRIFHALIFSFFFLGDKQQSFFSSLDMITDTAGQQLIDTNGQTLVTQNERHALVQKL